MIVKWLLLYILAPILLVSITIAVSVVLRRLFISKEIRRCMDDPLYIETFKRRFSKQTLTFYSSLIEKIAYNFDLSFPEKIQMDLIWIHRLVRLVSVRRLKRVLRFCTDKGLFDAFKVVLDHPKMNPVFLNYLQEQKKDAVINALAKQAYLKEFDGQKGYDLLKEEMKEVVALSQSGSPEDRWFAFKILAQADESAEEAAYKWEAFTDHFNQIRLNMVLQIKTTDTEKLYQCLFERLINDPCRLIRKTVKQLIVDRFQDRYHPNFDALTVWQKKHFAENFRAEFEADKKIAFDQLLNENLELRLFAADFLNETGGLNRLIQTVDINDVRKLDYSYTMLKSALEVYSDGFMEVLCNSNNPGALLCGAKLLLELGDRRQIENLAARVFALREAGLPDSNLSELYALTLDCIEKRGGEGAFRVLQNELIKVQYDPKRATLILKKIPERADVVFFETFIALLKNKKIPYQKELLELAARMPQQMVVPSLIRILKSETEEPWQVRLNAVVYFKTQNLDLCFQYLLENLHLFSEDSQKELLLNLYSFSKALFIETVDSVLSYLDSETSTPIILNLYVTRYMPFVKKIKTGLETGSAKIRHASVLGLFRFEQPDFYDTVIPLLSDPDKEVRLLTAQMLAASANPEQIQFIENTLADPNEMLSVKKALIRGLGVSGCPQSEALLLRSVEQNPFLYDAFFEALMQKRLPQIAEHLIELYIRGNDPERKMILQYFRYKGIKEEGFLLELLKEGNPAREAICDILYKTGFIDETISTLRNKSADLRSLALQTLLLINTIHAHKGVLVAARDNNSAIRTVAVQKIQELVHKNSSVIAELQEDSSKAVQKNINWLLHKLQKQQSGVGNEVGLS